MKNIDPVDLPAYRLYNIGLHFIKEGMDEEALISLERTLDECDLIAHPLHSLSINYKDRPISKKAVEAEQPAPPKPEDRHKYIPPWWRGEEAAYKSALIAKQGISTLPKMNS